MEQTVDAKLSNRNTAINRNTENEIESDLLYKEEEKTELRRDQYQEGCSILFFSRTNDLSSNFELCII
jgi:hypothetical protein